MLRLEPILEAIQPITDIQDGKCTNEVVQLFTSLKDEQSPGCIAYLSTMLLDNVEMFKGFLLCYSLVREALKRDEVRNLETLFQKESADGI